MSGIRRKLLVLPLDGRPVVHKQLEYLASLADWEILIPPISSLGYFREAANIEEIHLWVEEHASSVDGFALSLDTLIYGGLVASRICPDREADLLARCRILESLKHEYADKPVYGFLSTMRLSSNSVNEEEKEYWSVYGQAIWKWSYYSDKFRIHGDEADLKLAKEAKAAIPAGIQADYLGTRKRNTAITDAVLDYAANGVIDRLILPQDDNADYGFNTAEARRLKRVVADKNIEDRVLIYSGADEVAWTLIAALISHLEERRPRRVFCDWRHPEDAGQLIPRYEDRPVGLAVENQIQAAGAVVSNSLEDSDFILAIHTANHAQGDWAMGIPIEDDKAHTVSWIKRLQDYQNRGFLIAIADLAYANGGDPEFFNFAIELLDFEKITAYGAWNTASNSLGSIAAQIQLAPLAELPGSLLRLKLTRFVDDAFYQGHYRQILRRDIQRNLLDLDEGKTAFRNAANQWLSLHFASSALVTNVCFPWGRSFEIGFDLILPGASISR